MAGSNVNPEVITTGTRRERGTWRIWKLGRLWWIQYYAGGRQIRESSKSATKEVAKRLLRRRLGEAEAGLLVGAQSRRITYEVLRDALVADHVAKQSKSLRHNLDGTPRLDPVKKLDAFFAGRNAAAIDADLIRKFIADLQSKGLANGSINRSVGALRRMFHLAKRDGKLRNVPYFLMLPEATPRQGFFERREYEALRSALPDYLRVPLSIGYHTGMRAGEIVALEWEQVDFLGGVIRLRAGETKNNEARTVPLVPELRALLLEQHARRQAHCSNVCFRLNRKGRAVPIASFRKAWYKACEQVALGAMIDGKYHGKLFHDLRRTGVRNLVRAGVPDVVARQISGHKTRAVFDRYNIVSESDVLRAGDQLAAYHEKGANSGQIEVSEGAPDSCKEISVI